MTEFGWTAFIFNVQNGLISTEIPLCAEPTFDRTLNEGGSWSIRVQVDGRGVPRTVDLKGYLEPQRFGVALAWGNYIVQAGPIFSHSYEDSSRQLTVSGPSIWGLLKKRVVLKPGYTSVTDPSADTVFTGVAAGDIALTLMSNALASTYGSIAVDVPSLTGVGSIIDRTYFGYDLEPLSKALTDISQEYAAPDIDFVPYFGTAGDIRWRMAVGDLSGPTTIVEWDYSNNITTLDVDTDGSQLAEEVFVRGAGTQYTTLGVRHADSTFLVLPSPWPLSQAVNTDFTSDENIETLTAHGQGILSLYKSSVLTFNLVVRTDVAPLITEYTVGKTLIIDMQDHPWLGSGYFFSRILGINNGSDASTVVLKLDQIQQGAYA